MQFYKFTVWVMKDKIGERKAGHLIISSVTLSPGRLLSVSQAQFCTEYRMHDIGSVLQKKIFAKVWENPLAALCFLRKIKLTQMSNCLKLFSRSRIQEIQYWHSKVWKANEKKQIWKPINIDYQPIPHLLSGSQQRLSGYLIAGSYKCLD